MGENNGGIEGGEKRVEEHEMGVLQETKVDRKEVENGGEPREELGASLEYLQGEKAERKRMRGRRS